MCADEFVEMSFDMHGPGAILVQICPCVHVQKIHVLFEKLTNTHIYIHITSKAHIEERWSVRSNTNIYIYIYICMYKHV
jgi:hypothetical protein